MTARTARSSAGLRRSVFDHVTALTRKDPQPAAIPSELQSYVRKLAEHPYKILDREVEAMRAAGLSVDDVFEVTVVGAVAAGVVRMEIALAALEDAR